MSTLKIALETATSAGNLRKTGDICGGAEKYQRLYCLALRPILPQTAGRRVERLARLDSTLQLLPVPLYLLYFTLLYFTLLYLIFFDRASAPADDASDLRS
jgi:hypothetical protein